MKRWFAVRRHSAIGDAALLLIRLVAGVGLMMHGWAKIQNPFGWMGPDGFAPGFLQALAALSEFGGGLALILGLLVPLASAGIAGTMAVAVWFHAILRGDPFVATGGNPSYELAAVYLCVALLLAALGPGRLSADRMAFGSHR
jgi:putative oxidoreductase